MIKILNLAPADAPGLSMSREAFSALIKNDRAPAATLSEDQLRTAANTLHHMLA